MADSGLFSKDILRAELTYFSTLRLDKQNLLVFHDVQIMPNTVHTLSYTT